VSRQRPPPRSVLAAFGAAGAPLRPLAGGQGSSWLAGELVFKPADTDARQLEWQAGVYAAITCDGFRIARPRRSADGALCVDGWCAWERVPGRHQERRWPDIIDAGERFHAALSGIPRPGFLDRRADPWAISDRVAWGELPADDFGEVKHLPRLVAALRPVRAASQLLHGDLTGNVLFDDRLPPAIIDFSPYWRPVGFASAIVIADAVVFEGADETVLDAVGHIDRFGQFLLRALIYRAVTDWLGRQNLPVCPDGSDPWLPAVELACQRAVSES
jgi:uncharacterized protein (TIGR02569 family)